MDAHASFQQTRIKCVHGAAHTHRVSIQRLINGNHPFRSHIQGEVECGVLTTDNAFREADSDLLHKRSQEQLIPRRAYILAMAQFQKMTFEFFSSLRNERHGTLLRGIQQCSLIVVAVIHIGVEDYLRIITLRGSHSGFSQLRFNGVIRIHKTQIIAMGSVHTGITCSGDSLIGTMQNDNSTISACPFIAFLRASIRRAIINENNLKILIRLMHDAAHTTIKPSFNFIYRNHNTDQ